MFPPIKEQYDLNELIIVFEMPKPLVEMLIKKYPGPPEAEVAMKEFKSQFKSLYRKAAFKYHPDKPEGSKEKMQVVNKMYSVMMKSLRIINKPPQPQYVKVKVYSDGFYSYSDSTTSSNWW